MTAMATRLDLRMGPTRPSSSTMCLLAPPFVLSENGPNGPITYVYGLDRVSGAGPDFAYFYHTDGLGTVVNLTTNSGTAAKGYSYDAWGQPINPSWGNNR